MLGTAANGSTWGFSGQITEGWVGIVYDGKNAWISAKYGSVM
jgi:hypothetical protein